MIRIRFFGPGELIQNGFRAARYIVNPHASTLGKWSLLVDREEEERPGQTGRVRSFGGPRQSVAELDRTSPESLCTTNETDRFGLLVTLEMFKKSEPESGVTVGPLSVPALRRLDREGDKIQVAGRSQASTWVEAGQKCGTLREGKQVGVQCSTTPGDECEKRLEDILIHGRTVAPPVGLGRVQLRLGCCVADVSCGKGGLGRVVELAGFPVRYWDSRFGDKGDIGNPAILGQLTRDIRTGKTVLCMLTRSAATSVRKKTMSLEPASPFSASVIVHVCRVFSLTRCRVSFFATPEINALKRLDNTAMTSGDCCKYGSA